MISDLVEAAGRPVFYSGFRIGVRNDGGGCASTFAEASADKAAYPPYDFCAWAILVDALRLSTLRLDTGSGSGMTTTTTGFRIPGSSPGQAWSEMTAVFELRVIESVKY